jgi:hypothetical protein
MYPLIEVGLESDRLFTDHIDTFPFTPGAQFIIPKKNILKEISGDLGASAVFNILIKMFKTA